MTGKCYYLATLDAWNRHASKFASSHFVVLNPPNGLANGPAETARILALIEGDEGAHNSLEDDHAFEPLPHPLAQKAISEVAQAMLAPHGVGQSASTFDVAEALSKVHPLLRYRVF